MFEYLSIITAVASVITAAISSYWALVQRRRYRNMIGSLTETLQASWRLPRSLAAQHRLASLQPELTDVLEKLQKTFEELSGVPVSVALKVPFLSADSKTRVIRTFARDRESSQSREVLTYEYPIQNNPPIQMALSTGDTVIINNVRSPAEGGYASERVSPTHVPHKSVLMVPIFASDDPEHRVGVGLLSIDSPKAGAFDDRAVALAKSVAPLFGALLRSSLETPEKKTKPA